MQMPKFSLTRHSSRRKDQRGITEEMIFQVLEHISNLEGLHVLCPTDKFGTVITAYRNRDLSGVKPNMGRGRHKPRHIHSRKPLPRTTARDRSAWVQELGMPA